MEGVASTEVLGESRPDGILMNTAASAVCITFDLLRIREQFQPLQLLGCEIFCSQFTSPVTSTTDGGEDAVSQERVLDIGVGRGPR